MNDEREYALRARIQELEDQLRAAGGVDGDVEILTPEGNFLPEIEDDIIRNSTRISGLLLQLRELVELEHLSYDETNIATKYLASLPRELVDRALASVVSRSVTGLGPLPEPERDTVPPSPEVLAHAHDVARLKEKTHQVLEAARSDDPQALADVVGGMPATELGPMLMSAIRFLVRFGERREQP